MAACYVLLLRYDTQNKYRTSSTHQQLKYSHVTAGHAWSLAAVFGLNHATCARLHLLMSEEWSQGCCRMLVFYSKNIYSIARKYRCLKHFFLKISVFTFSKTPLPVKPLLFGSFTRIFATLKAFRNNSITLRRILWNRKMKLARAEGC